MNNKNKIIIKNVIGIISLILSIVLIFFIIKINLLPNKYTIIIGVILFVLELISFILINIKKKIFNIIGIILIILISMINVIGIWYIQKTDSFLNKSFNTKSTSKYTYYIITSSSNDYTEEDIKGDIYYYDNFDIDATKKYLGNKFNLKFLESENMSDLFTGIKDKNINFILIDKASFNMVFDIDKNLKKSDYKIIYEFYLSEKLSLENSNTKNTFTLFICGNDFAGFNDLNLLVTVNLKYRKAIITTIPRNYYIEVAGKDGRKDTLSFMSPYGLETSIKSIENYFKINIDYYLKINTHSLVELVDQIGGITYCSDQAYYTTHSLVLDTYNDDKGKFYVSKGCQQLNGIQTLTVARERLAFYDGDRTRQKNCVKIMQAILDKLISTNTLTNYGNILNSLANLYETNMQKTQISLIAKTIISSNGNINIETQSVDGYETKDYVHLSDYKDYVIVPYEDTVTTAVNNINALLKN